VGVELADIFSQYNSQYLAQYHQRVPTEQQQVIRAVVRCRTEALGGQVYRCPKCDELAYRYHSCRNRHCPKCQYQRTQQWLEKQQDFRLPVPYFLLTFTLPAEIRATAQKYPQLIYNLLFRASAAATQKLAQDPRFVGGKIGLMGVLHTWTRQLCYHPHVHYLVPAGGFTANQDWVPARNQFMLPVKALSKLFRAKFRDALRKHACFENVPTSVWQQDWVVHCKPVGGGGSALKYLASYVFRVAISNQRILKLSDGRVTFRYKETATGKTKTSSLSALDFMRRFLQHVLPKGFVKVRYYGFFSPGNRQLLAEIQQHLRLAFPEDFLSMTAEAQPIQQDFEVSVSCPQCGQTMVFLKTIPRHERSPPQSGFVTRVFST
jgi:uncharacterized C2H2 Zn-finger protein